MARLLLLLSDTRRLLRPVAISVAIAALTAIAAVIVSYLLYPVTGMEIRGARMFPQSEVWDAAPRYASLLSLNAEAFERRIESNPWVKSAEVLKDWESGIVTVEVEERSAVLDGRLGNRRVVLAADGTELPGVSRGDLERIELDERQLDEILGVVKMLDENKVRLDSVDKVDAGGVEATVEGSRVLFARGVVSTQVQTLKDLMEKHPEAPYYDLRSPERVVVGAVESSQEESEGQFEGPDE